jgi:pimeloyl-ACP methyl ester carboxylesterase
VIGVLAVAAAAYRLVPSVLVKTLAPRSRPQPYTPDSVGVNAVPVRLRSANDTALHAWFVPAGRDAPAVVVIHGWGANASLMLPLAPHLHRAGFHALFLDARNHGASEHDDFTSMPRFAEDVEAALDWLTARDDVRGIGLIGHSVGAAAVLLVGSRNPLPGAIVAVSSFAHPGELMAGAPPLGLLPRPLRNAAIAQVERIIGHRMDDIAPHSTIRRVSAPVMLVHGDADQVVPLSDLYRLTAANPDATHLVVPGGGHDSLEPYEPSIPRITAFLTAHLEGDGA